MKPCYALTPHGSYVALHLHHWFGVMPSDNGIPGAAEVVCCSPGADDMTYLYTWSAYRDQTEEGIVWKDGSVLAGNQLAAEEMLERLMAYLAGDLGGLVVIDDLATDIVQELGLEIPTLPCPRCGKQKPVREVRQAYYCQHSQGEETEEIPCADCREEMKDEEATTPG